MKRPIRSLLPIVSLVLFTVLASGCQRWREESRAAIPLEGGTRFMGPHPASSPAPPRMVASNSTPRNTAPRNTTAPRTSGGYTNPTINIPRTVPPGSRNRYGSVSTNQRILAMTFDDGPHPSNTPRLLDLLAKRNVKATFYVTGNNVQRYPQIVARMVREGHEVANHTWNHPYLTKISDTQIRSELQRTAKAIYAAAGVYPRTYRPPYGAINERLRGWIYKEFGYPTITWNVDPNDWQKPGPSVVASRLVSGARNGSILLAHDIHAGTITAMPSALDQLLAKGYRFVTVTQLINAGRMGSNSPQESPSAPQEPTADPLEGKKEQSESIASLPLTPLAEDPLVDAGVSADSSEAQILTQLIMPELPATMIDEVEMKVEVKATETVIAPSADEVPPQLKIFDLGSPIWK